MLLSSDTVLTAAHCRSSTSSFQVKHKSSRPPNIRCPMKKRVMGVHIEMKELRTQFRLLLGNTISHRAMVKQEYLQGTESIFKP